jgi:hypothetical protein
MEKVRRGFRWYWLLELEATTAAFVTGACLLMLLRIPVWAMFVGIFALGIGCDRAGRYRDRLRERLDSQWIDRPIVWRAVWWSFTIIVLLVFVLVEGEGGGFEGQP